VTLFLRYQADIWVEVDTGEEEVVSVLVDDLTMATPVDVLDDRDVDAGSQAKVLARHVADNRCWPSWNYGARPV